jgi:hypothetical protein
MNGLRKLRDVLYRPPRTLKDAAAHIMALPKLSGDHAASQAREILKNLRWKHGLRTYINFTHSAF